MVAEFLRRNGKVKFLLLIIRLYVGAVWFSHGWAKISKGSFNAAPFLQETVKKAAGSDPLVQGWWAGIVKLLLLPNVEIINYLIPVGELFVGIGLLAGLFTEKALYFGLMMNFSYLLSGSLDVNPQLILLSMMLLQARDNAGRIGVDGMLFGTLKKRMGGAPAKPPM